MEMLNDNDPMSNAPLPSGVRTREEWSVAAGARVLGHLDLVIHWSLVIAALVILRASPSTGKKRRNNRCV